MYPTDLTDAQWQAIEKVLPTKIKTRKRKHSLRVLVNAILYVTKGGIQWRMLPGNFPDWRLVYYYFGRLNRSGVVKLVHDALVTQTRQQAKREASPSLGLLDSQSVKTMSVTDHKGFDGNKRLTGRKRFVVVDVLGLVLSLSVTTANTGERAGAMTVLADLGRRFERLKTILADQGFDGAEFLTSVRQRFALRVEVVCQVLGIKGFQVLPKRWIVERTFGWWAFHRQLAKDYEVKTAHAEAFIYWSMIRLMARKIQKS